jgi:hypothetical protein
MPGWLPHAANLIATRVNRPMSDPRTSTAPRAGLGTDDRDSIATATL